MLRPLIGGGAALRAGEEWIATLPSGKLQADPAPAFFEKSHNPAIALGGKAYAMVPDPGVSTSVDIVAASGKSCGSIASGSDGPGLVFLGKDGTLIDLGGPAACTATYYGQALK